MSASTLVQATCSWCGLRARCVRGHDQGRTVAICSGCAHTAAEVHAADSALFLNAVRERDAANARAERAEAELRALRGELTRERDEARVDIEAMLAAGCVFWTLSRFVEWDAPGAAAA